MCPLLWVYYTYNNATGNITGGKVNTQSKQYKAMEEKGWISGVIQNESMMSPEEKMIYETFGGRDTIIKNLMKQYDSDGDLLNANGVAGMVAWRWTGSAGDKHFTL